MINPKKKSRQNKKELCEICKERKLKKYIHLTACNKPLCHTCLFTDIIIYNRTKCPFCRVDYKFNSLAQYVENKKILPLLKNISCNLLRDAFKKCTNKSELLKTFSDNSELCFRMSNAAIFAESEANSAILDIVPNLYEEFAHMLLNLPPFIVSIHKDKNILLIFKTDFYKMLEYSNLEEILQVLGISQIGFLSGGDLEIISLFKCIFKRSRKIKLKLECDLLGANSEMKNIHNKLLEEKSRFNNFYLSEKYEKINNFVMSINIKETEAGEF